MNIIEYKGYKAAIEFSAEDMALFGKVLDVGDDKMIFEIENPKNALALFKDIIDDYLTLCKEHNKTPIHQIKQYEHMHSMVDAAVCDTNALIRSDHFCKWSDTDHAYDIEFLKKRAEPLLTKYDGKLPPLAKEFEKEANTRWYGDGDLHCYFVFGFHTDGIDDNAQIYELMKNNRTNAEYVRDYYDEIYAVLTYKNPWCMRVRVFKITDSLRYEEQHNLLPPEYK